VIVATVQINACQDEKDNLDKALNFIDEAAAGGAAMVALTLKKRKNCQAADTPLALPASGFTF
jgi:hypothetical protein